MEELLKDFGKLIEEKKWYLAAEVAMVLLDEYPNVVFNNIGVGKYTESEIIELEKRGEDRKVAYWTGWLKKWGYGGYKKDPEGSFERVSRAAEAGHVKAITLKGYYLWEGIGVMPDRIAAMKCYEEAGAAGHIAACRYAGIIHTTERRYFLAALWYQRGSLLGCNVCDVKLDVLKVQYRSKICPWGQWRPDREYHFFVPPKIQEAVKTTLLLFKRLGITRYIAWQVCAYIVTQSGWD